MADAGYVSTIRVFFRKIGRIKYISHLDLNRCMARVLKRSGLPVWHTLGFHPHIYITFALPLPLGFESNCESMDFRLTRDISMQEVCDRLNEVMPEGLTAISAQPKGAKPNAICWADYEITMEYDQQNTQTVAEHLNLFCNKEVIEITKRSKKGDRLLDIKPHIKVGEIQTSENTLKFKLRTAAGSTLNINPMLLLDAFAKESGTQWDWLRIVRIAILDKELENFS